MAVTIIPLPGGGRVVYELDRLNSSFNLANLYMYRLIDDSSDVIKGDGDFVPNVDDVIYDFKLGWFRVGHVDLTSYTVDLVFWEPPKNDSDVGVDDVLLGVGPGYSSESWRVLLDTRVFPHRLDIDMKFFMYGVEAKEVRIFRGVNTTDTGEVISAYYSQGEYVSDAIPLDFAGQHILYNKAIKAPAQGYTTKEGLLDGQIVTVVTYSNSGAPTSYAKMLIMNTNLTRHANDSMKRVKSIEVISPYLSKTEPNTLEVPVDSTMETLVMRAKVTYADGSSRTMDIVDEDANGKFKLLGLKWWSPSQTGRPQGLKLVYELSESEEYSYLQGETVNGKVITSYRIIGIPVDPARSLKVYAFPVWLNSMQGYGLEYWLYDLDRQVARSIPKGAVALAENSPPFDGLEFTSVQHLRIGVTLKAVDVEYGEDVHTQQIQVALLRDGGLNMANWKVKFSGAQEVWFGNGTNAIVHALTGGISTVNVSQELTDYSVWLKQLYYSIDPLYDPQTELAGLEPTHFIITTKTRAFKVPITSWRQDINFVTDLGEGETLYLKWVKETASGDLQLGISGLPQHSV
jgi:hypothetical protein